MGANTSDLTIADIEEVQSISNLSTKEIKTLYRRFKKLDKDQTGEITLDDFSSIPELVMNPLASRVVQMFNTQKTKHVNFRQFLETLAPFSPEASNEQKLQFLFRVYDVDEDDFIGFDDLKVILKLMAGDNLNDEQVNKIVSKTLTEGDKDEDGKLSKEEFVDAFANYDLTKMSFKF